MAAKARKLRILCLHGYRQNKDTFREKTGALRKGVKKFADLVYVTAPYAVDCEENKELPDAAPEEGKDARQMGWYFCKKSTYDHEEIVPTYEGLDGTIDLLENVFKTEGPFDGVLAFSQGASLLSVLCALRKDSGHLRSREIFDFKFGIFFSGFHFLSREYEDVYTEPLNCRTLHIYGSTDAVIATDRSKKLAEAFADAATAEHDGGHYVSWGKAGAPSRVALVDFLQKEQAFTVEDESQ